MKANTFSTRVTRQLAFILRSNSMHDSEILREKLFMTNTDGLREKLFATLITTLNVFFARKNCASPMSRNHFYSLKKIEKLAEFSRIIYVQPSVFLARNFAVVELGLDYLNNSKSTVISSTFQGSTILLPCLYTYKTFTLHHVK